MFGPYVLVVWVGNFDGQGNPAFVGVQAAAPLFFRLTDAITLNDPHLNEPVFRQPPRLELGRQILRDLRERGGRTREERRENERTSHGVPTSR